MPATVIIPLTGDRTVHFIARSTNVLFVASGGSVTPAEINALRPRACQRLSDEARADICDGGITYHPRRDIGQPGRTYHTRLAPRPGGEVRLN